MEEEDERREAAISSAASLQPSFKPPVGVTRSQLAKFQELHRRRLQIKSRWKTKTKSKVMVDGTTRRIHEMDLSAKDSTVENLSKTIDDSSISISISGNFKDVSSMEQDKVAANVASKKRQKLHWGLDTKERWERKSNM